MSEKIVAQGKVILEVSADKNEYHFKYVIGDGVPKVMADGETKYLSSEVAGGFTGVYIGLYATSNGMKNSTPADFDYFIYRI